MNKKGQVVFYGMMVGLAVIILALALAPAVQQVTTDARNVTNGDTLGLDCSNSSISNYDKAACYTTDFSLFYIIGSIILIGGGIIVAKIIFT